MAGKYSHFIWVFVLGFLSCTSPQNSNGTNGWVSLFDGKTLQGWHTLPGGAWKIENGILTGTNQVTDSNHGLLITDSIYTDFELSVDYLAEKGNSGLYFRVDKAGPYGVEGLQAEIDPLHGAGGLYETGGRDWVVEPTAADVNSWYKPGEWNNMTVKAVGSSVTVHVNGSTTAAIQNDPGRRKGHIALQLHGDQDVKVSFKNIKIKPL